MKVTYICIKGNSVLNFVKGQTFTVDKGSEEENFFKSVPDSFDRILQSDEAWKSGDYVRLSGRFINLTHMSKNGRFGRGETLDKMPAKITQITYRNSVEGTVTFTAMNGIKYKADNISLIKEESAIKTKNNAPIVDALPMYWFINSEGIICMAIEGKNEKADNWRLVSGNRFADVQQARAKYDMMFSTRSEAYKSPDIKQSL